MLRLVFSAKDRSAYSVALPYDESKEVGLSLDELRWGVSEYVIVSAFRRQKKVTTLSPRELGSGRIENLTTLGELGADGYGSVLEYVEANEGRGSRLARVEELAKGVKSGRYDPAWFIERSNGRLVCVDGNTRALLCQEYGVPLKCKILRIEDL
jgi:hypothetical protein